MRVTISHVLFGLVLQFPLTSAACVLRNDGAGESTGGEAAQAGKGGVRSVGGAASGAVTAGGAAGWQSSGGESGATPMAAGEAGASAAGTGGATAGAPSWGVFVLQGHLGRIDVSCDDGKSWPVHSSEDDNARCWAKDNQPDCDHNPWAGRGLAFGDGWFFSTLGWGPSGVSGVPNGSVRRSRNGTEWELASSGATTFGGLAAGGGVVVGGRALPMVSLDEGKTFKDAGSSAHSDGHVRFSRYVPIAGGRWIVVVDGGRLGISSDRGATFWTPDTLPAGCAEDLQTDGGIASGNGALVVVGGNGVACRSVDGGKSFTSVTVAAGASQLVFDGSKFRFWWSGRAYSSADGTTWESAELVPAGVHLGPAAANPNGTIVAVNGGWADWYEKQRFFRSTDGVHFDELPARSFTGSHPVRFMAYGAVSARPACR